MNFRKHFAAACLVLLAISLKAQDDPMKILEKESAEVKTTAIATFKTTRLINFHTVEVLGKRTLDFRISHRFGPMNTGPENFWGLDGGASIRLGLEYSYDGRLMFGFGRTSYEKMLDGFLKYKLLSQTEGKGMPVSLTLFTGMYCTTQKPPEKDATGFDRYENFYSRLSYNFQAIVARKFSPAFSAQIAPWFVHYNQVESITDANDAYGIAGVVRYKFSRSMAVTAEYGFRINDYSNQDYYDSFGLGIEIETGGHVFQMHLTNSFGLVENQYFARTTDKWAKGGIRLGFNISRVFTI